MAGVSGLDWTKRDGVAFTQGRRGVEEHMSQSADFE